MTAEMVMIWTLVLLLVGIYCIVQAVRDFRRRNYLLAAIGAACVVALWTLPNKNAVIKVDLPVR